MKTQVIRHKKFEILSWLLLILGFIVIASVLIQHFESYDQKAIIKTFPQALWYTLVTISTVGYGDHYPVTNEGKVIGSLVIIFAIGFAGYAVGKIQSSAAEESQP